MYEYNEERGIGIMGTTFICNNENIASIDENQSFKIGEEITIEIKVIDKNKWSKEIKNKCTKYKIINIEHKVYVGYSYTVNTHYNQFVYLEEIEVL